MLASATFHVPTEKKPWWKVRVQVAPVKYPRRRHCHRRESRPADPEHPALHERVVPAARPSAASRAHRRAAARDAAKLHFYGHGAGAGCRCHGAAFAEHWHVAH